MINDGGQAFPMQERDDALKGMTLLDYFAAKAMQGLLACGELHYSIAHERAYEIAQAMLTQKQLLGGKHE